MAKSREARSGSARKKTKEERKFHIEVARQMLTLATSGFGLVAALAWNNVVQEFVKSYVRKFLPGSDTGILSLLVYAIVVTVLAVFVTYNLSRILKK